MTSDTLISLIDAWVQRGWLRPLDRAFLGFVHSLDPSAEPGFLLAAALASHQLGRGHICLDLAATLENPDASLSLPPEGEYGGPLPELPSQHLAGQTPASWRGCIAASPLAGAGPGNTPLVLDGDRLYLRRYWQYEQQVAQAIRARLEQPAEPAEALAEYLPALFPPTVDGSGPDWQKIACALAARGRFSIITGGPGTGKTTTVVRLLALLQSRAQAQGRPLRIRLAAPTGKAAARLTESIGSAIAKLPGGMGQDIPSEAGTLHQLLGARPGTRQFRHHAGNPLHADLVVVDEASMIDLEMMAALLDALRPDSRLVLLGDKDQLASVEAGSVLGDLCQRAEGGGYRPETLAWLQAASGEELSAYAGDHGPLAQHITMLRVSHRFHGGSGIGRLAAAVNAGQGEAAAAILRQTAYPDLAHIALSSADDPRLAALCLDGVAGAQGYRHYLEVLRNRRPAADAPDEAYAEWSAAVLDAFDQFQLLCALRRGPWGVEAQNRRIAHSLQQAGLIDAAQGWYEGRPVLATRNDYALGLMNGDIGIALRYPDSAGGNRLRVVFRQPGQGLRHILPSRLIDVETVYAMTVHKSQGSEFAHVALLLPDQASPILTRELVYTGITRAKQHFSLAVPDPAVFLQAVRHKVRRSGGLAQCLEA
jgi:exodeoxyribonuclease V alpha subunit